MNDLKAVYKYIDIQVTKTSKDDTDVINVSKQLKNIISRSEIESHFQIV